MQELYRQSYTRKCRPHLEFPHRLQYSICAWLLTQATIHKILIGASAYCDIIYMENGLLNPEVEEEELYVRILTITFISFMISIVTMSALHMRGCPPSHDLRRNNVFT